MNKKLSVLFLLVCFIVVLLSGCMYPEEKKYKIKHHMKIKSKRYKRPLITFKRIMMEFFQSKTVETTPIYQKYLIDFKRIVPKYMAEPPGNAFESGGIFQYVIVMYETCSNCKDI